MQKWIFQAVDAYISWLPFCPILTGYKRHCWLCPYEEAERNMFCGLWIRLSSGCVAFCWFCINDAQQTLHSPYIDIHNFAVSGCYRGTCFYLQYIHQKPFRFGQAERFVPHENQLKLQDKNLQHGLQNQKHAWKWLKIPDHLPPKNALCQALTC